MITTTEVSKEQATRMAIDFVRDYAENGCQHRCTRLNCSHLGNLRLAKAQEIVALIDKQVVDDCQKVDLKRKSKG